MSKVGSNNVGSSHQTGFVPGSLAMPSVEAKLPVVGDADLVKLREDLNELEALKASDIELAHTLKEISEKKLSREELNLELEKLPVESRAGALSVLAQIEHNKLIAWHGDALQQVANKGDTTKLDIAVTLEVGAPNESPIDAVRRQNLVSIKNERIAILLEKYPELFTKEGLEAVLTTSGKSALIENFLDNTSTLKWEDKVGELQRAGAFKPGEEVAYREMVFLRDTQNSLKELLDAQLTKGVYLTPSNKGHLDAMGKVAKENSRIEAAKKKLEALRADIPEGLKDSMEAESLRTFEQLASAAERQGLLAYEDHVKSEVARGEAEYEEAAKKGGALFEATNILIAARNALPKMLESTELLTVGNLAQLGGLLRSGGSLDAARDAGAKFVEDSRKFHNEHSWGGSVFGSDQEFAKLTDLQLGVKLAPVSHFGDAVVSPVFGLLDVARVEVSRRNALGEILRFNKFSNYYYGVESDPLADLSFHQYRQLEQTDSLLSGARYSFQVAKISASLAVMRPESLGGAVKMLSGSIGMGAIGSAGQEFLRDDGEFEWGRFMENTLSQIADSSMFMAGMSAFSSAFVNSRLGSIGSKLAKGEALTKIEIDAVRAAQGQSVLIREFIDNLDGLGDVAGSILNFDDMKTARQALGAILVFGTATSDVGDVNLGLGDKVGSGVDSFLNNRKTEEGKGVSIPVLEEGAVEKLRTEIAGLEGLSLTAVDPRTKEEILRTPAVREKGVETESKPKVKLRSVREEFEFKETGRVFIAHDNVQVPIQCLVVEGKEYEGYLRKNEKVFYLVNESEIPDLYASILKTREETDENGSYDVSSFIDKETGLIFTAMPRANETPAETGDRVADDTHEKQHRTDLVAGREIDENRAYARASKYANDPTTVTFNESRYQGAKNLSLAASRNDFKLDLTEEATTRTREFLDDLSPQTQKLYNSAIYLGKREFRISKLLDLLNLVIVFEEKRRSKKYALQKPLVAQELAKAKQLLFREIEGFETIANSRELQGQKAKLAQILKALPDLVSKMKLNGADSRPVASEKLSLFRDIESGSGLLSRSIESYSEAIPEQLIKELVYSTQYKLKVKGIASKVETDKDGYNYLVIQPVMRTNTIDTLLEDLSIDRLAVRLNTEAGGKVKLVYHPYRLLIRGASGIYNARDDISDGSVFYLSDRAATNGYVSETEYHEMVHWRLVKFLKMGLPHFAEGIVNGNIKVSGYEDKFSLQELITSALDLEKADINHAQDSNFRKNVVRLKAFLATLNGVDENTPIETIGGELYRGINIIDENNKVCGNIVFPYASRFRRADGVNSQDFSKEDRYISGRLRELAHFRRNVSRSIDRIGKIYSSAFHENRGVLSEKQLEEVKKYASRISLRAYKSVGKALANWDPVEAEKNPMPVLKRDGVVDDVLLNVASREDEGAHDYFGWRNPFSDIAHTIDQDRILEEFVSFFIGPYGNNPELICRYLENLEDRLREGEIARVTEIYDRLCGSLEVAQIISFLHNLGSYFNRSRFMAIEDAELSDFERSLEDLVSLFLRKHSIPIVRYQAALTERESDGYYADVRFDGIRIVAKPFPVRAIHNIADTFRRSMSTCQLQFEEVASDLVAVKNRERGELSYIQVPSTILSPALFMLDDLVKLGTMSLITNYQYFVLAVLRCKWSLDRNSNGKHNLAEFLREGFPSIPLQSLVDFVDAVNGFYQYHVKQLETWDVEETPLKKSAKSCIDKIQFLASSDLANLTKESSDSWNKGITEFFGAKSATDVYAALEVLAKVIEEELTPNIEQNSELARAIHTLESLLERRVTVFLDLKREHDRAEVDDPRWVSRILSDFFKEHPDFIVELVSWVQAQYTAAVDSVDALAVVSPRGAFSDPCLFLSEDRERELLSEAFYLVHSGQLKSAIEVDLGISLRDLSKRDQVQILNYLYAQNNEEYKRLKRVLKNYGGEKSILLRAFFGVAEGVSFGNTILDVAENLSSETSQEVLSRYVDILNGIDNIDLIALSANQEPMTALERESLLERYLVGANKIIHNIASMRDSDVSPYLEALVSASDAALKLGSVYASTLRVGKITDIRLDGFEVSDRGLLAGEISSENREKLEELSFHNTRQRYPEPERIFPPSLQDFCQHKLELFFTKPNEHYRLYQVKLRGEVLAMCIIKDAESPDGRKTVTVNSVNTVQIGQGFGLIQSFLRHVMEIEGGDDTRFILEIYENNRQASKLYQNLGYVFDDKYNLKASDLIEESAWSLDRNWQLLGMVKEPSRSISSFNPRLDSLGPNLKSYAEGLSRDGTVALGDEIAQEFLSVFDEEKAEVLRKKKELTKIPLGQTWVDVCRDDIKAAHKRIIEAAKYSLMAAGQVFEIGKSEWGETIVIAKSKGIIGGENGSARGRGDLNAYAKTQGKRGVSLTFNPGELIAYDIGGVYGGSDENKRIGISPEAIAFGRILATEYHEKIHAILDYYCAQGLRNIFNGYLNGAWNNLVAYGNFLNFEEFATWPEQISYLMKDYLSVIVKGDLELADKQLRAIVSKLFTFKNMTYGFLDRCESVFKEFQDSEFVVKEEDGKCIVSVNKAFRVGLNTVETKLDLGFVTLFKNEDGSVNTRKAIQDARDQLQELVSFNQGQLVKLNQILSGAKDVVDGKKLKIEQRIDLMTKHYQDNLDDHRILVEGCLNLSSGVHAEIARSIEEGSGVRNFKVARRPVTEDRYSILDWFDGLGSRLFSRKRKAVLSAEDIPQELKEKISSFVDHIALNGRKSGPMGIYDPNLTMSLVFHIEALPLKYMDYFAGLISNLRTEETLDMVQLLEMASLLGASGNYGTRTVRIKAQTILEKIKLDHPSPLVRMRAEKAHEFSLLAWSMPQTFFISAPFFAHDPFYASDLSRPRKALSAEGEAYSEMMLSRFSLPAEYEGLRAMKFSSDAVLLVDQALNGRYLVVMPKGTSLHTADGVDSMMGDGSDFRSQMLSVDQELLEQKKTSSQIFCAQFISWVEGKISRHPEREFFSDMYELFLASYNGGYGDYTEAAMIALDMCIGMQERVEHGYNDNFFSASNKWMSENERIGREIRSARKGIMKGTGQSPSKEGLESSCVQPIPSYNIVAVEGLHADPLVCPLGELEDRDLGLLMSQATDSDLRSKIEKDLSISFKELRARTVVHLIRYLASKHDEGFSKLKQVLAKNTDIKISLLNMFLTNAEDGGLCDKVLDMALEMDSFSPQKQNKFRLIIEKYNEVTQALDDSKQVIAESGLSNTDLADLRAISRSILQRANKVLASALDKFAANTLTGIDMGTLGEIRAEAILFGSIYKAAKELRVSLDLDALKDSELRRVSATSLTAEDREKILKISEDNVRQYPELYSMEAQKSLIEFLNKNNAYCYVLKYKGEIISFIGFMPREDGILYSQSFNTSPNVRGMSIGALFFKIANDLEGRDKIIEGLVWSDNPMLERYLDLGFQEAGKEPNWRNSGVDLIRIRRMPKP